MIRTTKASILLELAQHATVPVINGLNDVTHPCQLMADVMTFEEHLGTIEGKVVAWSGDGNNMATSWIHAAVRSEEHTYELKSLMRISYAVLSSYKKAPNNTQ